MILNATFLVSISNPVGLAPLQAASTFTLGPVMSGFRTSGVKGLGPREEKPTIAGAGFTSNYVPKN